MVFISLHVLIVCHILHTVDEQKKKDKKKEQNDNGTYFIGCGN